MDLINFDINKDIFNLNKNKEIHDLLIKEKHKLIDNVKNIADKKWKIKIGNIIFEKFVINTISDTLKEKIKFNFIFFKNEKNNKDEWRCLKSIDTKEFYFNINKNNIWNEVNQIVDLSLKEIEIEIFLKKMNIYYSEILNIDFLQKILNEKDKVSFTQKIINKYISDFKDEGIYFKDNNILLEEENFCRTFYESQRSFLFYPSKEEDLNIKNIYKLIDVNFEILFLFKRIFLYWKSEIIESLLNKLEINEKIELLFCFWCLDIFFSNLKRQNLYIILPYQLIQNQINFSMLNFFRTAEEDNFINNHLFKTVKWSKKHRESKDFSDLIESSEEAFFIWKNKMMEKTKIENYQKLFEIQQKLFSLSGFSRNYILKNGKINNLNGEPIKQLSTGLQNIFYRIIYPLTNIDILKSKYIFLFYDDIQDTFDDENIINTANLLRNMDKFISFYNKDCKVKTINFTHSTFFSKILIGNRKNRNIINLNKDYYNSNVHTEILKYSFPDIVSSSIEFLKLNFENKKFIFNTMNSCRTIYEWILSFWNKEKIENEFGIEIFNFLENDVNIYSHYNNNIPFDSSKTNLKIVSNFLEKLKIIFPNKFI